MRCLHYCVLLLLRLQGFLGGSLGHSRRGRGVLAHLLPIGYLQHEHSRGCACPPRSAGPEAGAVALLLYKRAAQQGDHAALLSIGDSYWWVGRQWRR